MGSRSKNYIGIVVLDFLSDFHILFINVFNVIHLVAGWIDLEKILPGPLWAGTKHYSKEAVWRKFSHLFFLMWIKWHGLITRIVMCVSKVNKSFDFMQILNFVSQYRFTSSLP